MTFALRYQCICKGGADGAILGTDHQVDVRDFVAVARESFSDIELHVREHLLKGTKVGGLKRRGKVKQQGQRTQPPLQESPFFATKIDVGVPPSLQIL